MWDEEARDDSSGDEGSESDGEFSPQLESRGGINGYPSRGQVPEDDAKEKAPKESKEREKAAQAKRTKRKSKKKKKSKKAKIQRAPYCEDWSMVKWKTGLKLGSGAYGVVYLGLREDGAMFAVKQIPLRADSQVHPPSRPFKVRSDSLTLACCLQNFLRIWPRRRRRLR